jgi:hypothetical protein
VDKEIMFIILDVVNDLNMVFWFSAERRREEMS